MRARSWWHLYGLVVNAGNRHRDGARERASGRFSLVLLIGNFVRAPSVYDLYGIACTNFLEDTTSTAHISTRSRTLATLAKQTVLCERLCEPSLWHCVHKFFGRHYFANARTARDARPAVSCAHQQVALADNLVRRERTSSAVGPGRHLSSIRMALAVAG